MADTNEHDVLIIYDSGLSDNNFDKNFNCDRGKALPHLTTLGTKTVHNGLNARDDYAVV